MSGAIIRVEFVSAALGGREFPVRLTASYRPHLRVGNGEYLGVRFIDGPDNPVPIGVAVDAKVQFMYAPEVDYAALRVGTQFQVLEGAHIVGIGRVLEVFADQP